MARTLGITNQPMFSRLKQFFRQQGTSAPPTEKALTLRLPLPPTPENAPQLAQKMVETVARLDGITLDYSVESLETLDSRILAFRDQGATSAEMPETLFMLGCYLGEVLNRHLGGKWLAPNQPVAGFAVLAIELDVGLHANPIGKVFKLLENGTEDRTEWLYEVLAEEKSRRTAPPRDT